MPSDATSTTSILQAKQYYVDWQVMQYYVVCASKQAQQYYVVSASDNNNSRYVTPMSHIRIGSLMAVTHFPVATPCT